jgi:hypothetical protein
MNNHRAIDTKAIAQIWAMRGPYEGELLVSGRSPDGESWLYSPADAIQAIRKTPGKWEVVEKWKLPD